MARKGKSTGDLESTWLLFQRNDNHLATALPCPRGRLRTNLLVVRYPQSFAKARTSSTERTLARATNTRLSVPSSTYVLRLLGFTGSSHCGGPISCRDLPGIGAEWPRGQVMKKTDETIEAGATRKLGELGLDPIVPLPLCAGSGIGAR
jgi:hypothetical protein